MLSTLYCFVVKSKLIAKSFPLVGLEHQHHPNAYPYELDPISGKMGL